ncbi:hypothetical protein V1511DRAFT_486577 [Dipodascopsis uninucleata]
MVDQRNGSNTDDSAVEIKKEFLYRRYVPTDHKGAMKLIADGYAERRSTANKSIITRWQFYAFCTPLIGCVFFKYNHLQDLGTILLLVCGIFLAMMSLVGRITDPLRDQARDVFKSTDFLGAADYGFVAIYGSDVVGVCTLQFVEIQDPSSPDPLQSGNIIAKAKLTKGKKRYHAIITSWNVLKKYRRVGLGSDLLTQALEVAKQDRALGVYVQCSSLEHAACSAFKSFGFKLIASIRLPGNLGRTGIATETWLLDPEKWSKEAK